jgi:hypothetical protein
LHPLYLGYHVSCIFPMEGEVGNYTFVNLFDELHNQGFRVRATLEECKYVFFIPLVLPQIIISQRAEVGAFLGIIETNLPGCKRLPFFNQQHEHGTKVGRGVRLPRSRNGHSIRGTNYKPRPHRTYAALACMWNDDLD